MISPKKGQREAMPASTAELPPDAIVDFTRTVQEFHTITEKFGLEPTRRHATYYYKGHMQLGSGRVIWPDSVIDALSFKQQQPLGSVIEVTEQNGVTSVGLETFLDGGSAIHMHCSQSPSGTPVHDCYFDKYPLRSDPGQFGITLATLALPPRLSQGVYNTKLNDNDRLQPVDPLNQTILRFIESGLTENCRSESIAEYELEYSSPYERYPVGVIVKIVKKPSGLTKHHLRLQVSAAGKYSIRDIVIEIKYNITLNQLVREFEVSQKQSDYSLESFTLNDSSLDDGSSNEGLIDYAQTVMDKLILQIKQQARG